MARRATPRHATPRHATPRHAPPRHATPSHATPHLATPRHATLRYSIICHRVRDLSHLNITQACLLYLYNMWMEERHPTGATPGERIHAPSLQSVVHMRWVLMPQPAVCPRLGLFGSSCTTGRQTLLPRSPPAHGVGPRSTFRDAAPARRLPEILGGGSARCLAALAGGGAGRGRGASGCAPLGDRCRAADDVRRRGRGWAGQRVPVAGQRVPVPGQRVPTLPGLGERVRADRAGRQPRAGAEDGPVRGLSRGPRVQLLITIIILLSLLLLLLLLFI